MIRFIQVWIYEFVGSLRCVEHEGVPRLGQRLIAFDFHQVLDVDRESRLTVRTISELTDLATVWRRC